MSQLVPETTPMVMVVSYRALMGLRDAPPGDQEYQGLVNALTGAAEEAVTEEGLERPPNDIGVPPNPEVIDLLDEAHVTWELGDVNGAQLNIYEAIVVEDDDPELPRRLLAAIGQNNAYEDFRPMLEFHVNGVPGFEPPPFGFAGMPMCMAPDRLAVFKQFLDAEQVHYGLTFVPPSPGGEFYEEDEPFELDPDAPVAPEKSEWPLALAHFGFDRTETDPLGQAREIAERDGLKVISVGHDPRPPRGVTVVYDVSHYPRVGDWVIAPSGERFLAQGVIMAGTVFALQELAPDVYTAGTIQLSNFDLDHSPQNGWRVERTDNRALPELVQVDNTFVPPTEATKHLPRVQFTEPRTW